MIVISTDRGFCGGLNNNLFRLCLSDIQAHQKNGIEVDMSLIGHRAEMFFSRLDMNIVSYAHHLGDSPSIQCLIGSVKVMLDAYDEEKIDQLVVYYNRFVNTIAQTPTSQLVLPLKPEVSEQNSHWDYLYEPDAKTLLGQLLTRYIESQVLSLIHI